MMDSEIPSERYRVVNLLRIAHNLPHASSLSVLLSMALSVLLLINVVVINLGDIWVNATVLLDEDFASGLAIIGLAIAILLICCKRLLQHFDLLLVSLVIVPLSVRIVFYHFYGNQELLAIYSGLDLPLNPFGWNVSIIAAFVSSLLGMVNDGLVLQITVLVLVWYVARLVGMHVYCWLAAILDATLLNYAPRWLVLWTVRLRNFRRYLLPSRQAQDLLQYNRYFLDFFVYLHLTKSPQDPEDVDDIPAGQRSENDDRPAAQVVRCIHCETLNRIHPRQVEGRYTCGNCGMDLFADDPQGAPDNFAIDGHDEADYYRILDLPPSTDLEQIKDAYKRMVKRYHPDAVANLGPEFVQLAHQRTIEINHAYQKLTDICNMTRR